jgi:hypothetical protein
MCPFICTVTQRADCDQCAVLFCLFALHNSVKQAVPTLWNGSAFHRRVEAPHSFELVETYNHVSLLRAARALRTPDLGGVCVNHTSKPGVKESS